MAVKTPSETIVGLEDPASLQTLLQSPTFTRTAPATTSSTLSATGIVPSSTTSGTPTIDTVGLFATSTEDVVVVPVSDTSTTIGGTTQNLTFNTDSNRSVVIAGITTTETSTAIVDSVSVYNAGGDVFVTGVDQRTVQQFVSGGTDYVLPPATDTTLGGVIVDGTTILVDSSGVISAAPGGYTLPTATTTVLGGVKIDGSTININGDGVISANGVVLSVDVSGGATGLTTTGGPITSTGTITLEGVLNVEHGGTGANTLTGYVVANGTNAFTATPTIPFSSITGTVPVDQGGTGQTGFAAGYLTSNGTALSSVASIPASDISGNISGNANNVTGTVAIANGGTGESNKTTAFNALAPSTTTGDLIYYDGSNNVSLGIGSAGQVLTVTAGVPSWANGSSYELPTASTLVLGGVKVDGTTITIDGSGVISASGGGAITQIVAGSNISVSNGGVGTVTIDNTYTLPTSSNTVLGGVKVDGTTIVIDGSGVISATAGGSGTVTSVGLSGGTTGLTVDNTPITTSGTMTLSGVLAVEHGGTGANTASGSFTALAPSQTGNVGRLLTTDGTTASWTSLGITNELYVSKGGNDSTGNGSITNPFLTITAALNYLNSNYPVSTGSGTPFVVVIGPGNYVEDVVIDRLLTNLWGYEGKLKTTRISGSVTVTSAVDYSGLFQNNVSLNNLFIADANNPAVQWTGNIPMSLDITNCVLYTSSTGTPLVISNTATGGNRLRVTQTDINAIGNAPAVDITNITNGIITGVNTSSAVTSGSAWRFTDSVVTIDTLQLTSATAPSLVSITGGTSVINIGYSALTSTTANGNGITISTAGARAIVGDCFYNIPLGTGYAVTGTAGGIYVRGGNQALPGTNNGVNPTLAATTFTMSTHIAAADLIGTVAIANGGTGQSTKTAAFDALAPSTTTGDLIYYNGTDNVRLPIGTSGQVLAVSNGIPSWTTSGGGGYVLPTAGVGSGGELGGVKVDGTTITIDGSGVISATGGGGSGTVTSVSIVSSNGFSGSVATSTTTPAITLGTTVTGLLKGNGAAISAAVANTDYQLPITLTTTGTSGAATFTGNVLNIPQYTGSVTQLVGGTNISVSNSGVGTVTIDNTYTLPVASNTVSGGVKVDGTTIVIDGSGVISATATGTVTSVQVSGGTTGLTAIGGPITGSGTITLGGTLAVANGGTGVTTSTGTGSVVLSGSPALTTPNIGTPSFATLTNATGLPLSTGVTGTLAIVNGGTGATTKTAAFDALAPSTTTGDLIYYNGTDNVRLGIGTAGQVLTVSGGIPAWTAASGGSPGGSNTELQFNNAGSFGGISSVTWNGTALSLGSNTQVKITGGTSGQVLSTDGSGNLSWAAAGGSGLSKLVYRVDYLSNGNIDTSKGNNGVTTLVGTGTGTTLNDVSTSAQIRLTFTGYSAPPLNIMFYGYNPSAAPPTYNIRQLQASLPARSLAGADTAFTAFDPAVNTMTINVIKADVGASGTGVVTHVIIVFIMG